MTYTVTTKYNGKVVETRAGVPEEIAKGIKEEIEELYPSETKNGVTQVILEKE